MKSNHSFRFCRGPLAGALTLLGFAVHASAQEALPAPAPTAAPAEAPATTTPAGGAPAVSLGRVRLGGQLLLRWLYSDRLLSQPGAAQPTSVYTVAPSFNALIGDRLTAAYSPSADFYSSDRLRDTIGHSANIAYSLSGYRWGFSAAQSFSQGEQAQIETGRQTKQRSWVTTASASTSVGNRTSFSLESTFSNRSAASFNDEQSLSGMLWAHYRPAQRATFRLGGGAGKSSMSVGGDMTFVRWQTGVAIPVGEKLSLDASAGVENRSFGTGAATTRNKPVFTVSANYRPVETTTLSLSATRGTSGSLFSAQAVDRESWNARLSQRLLQRFWLSFGYSRSESTYFRTVAASTVTRSDRTESFDAGVSTALGKRTRLGCSYRRSENSSNSSAFAYTSKQYSADVSWRF